MEQEYTATKLGTKFNVKGKIKKEYHHNLTYRVKCPMKNCPKFCNGETGRSLIEWFNENIRKDINSHIFKDSIEANLPTMTLENFTVVCSGYRNRKFKKKVSESLLIRHSKLTINKHGTSVPLKLFK